MRPPQEGMVNGAMNPVEREVGEYDTEENLYRFGELAEPVSMHGPTEIDRIISDAHEGFHIFPENNDHRHRRDIDEKIAPPVYFETGSPFFPVIEEEHHGYKGDKLDYKTGLDHRYVPFLVETDGNFQGLKLSCANNGVNRK
jgi:hypothetical protein